MSRPAFHRLRIAELRRETADCVSLAFDVPDALREAYRYVPGQYLTLSAMLEGEEVRRSYSICSGLDDGELRVAIKHLPGGAFSGWANEALATGATLDVMTPDGRFGLAPAPGATRTLVGFAAGSGITPIMAILKTTLTREHGRFILFDGNRSSADIIFREQLENLKDRYLDRLVVFHVLSRERQDIAVLNGRLDPAKLKVLARALVPLPAVDHAFLCGPQPMIEGLEPALFGLGLQRGQVHVERFTPGVGGRPRPLPLPADAPAAARATVTFEGARSEFPVAAGETIIDAGLRAGLNLPYSCKGGMCSTCRAQLTDGRVEMDVNYALEPWETKAGYVLTCQSRPLTPTVAVDYDQV